MDRGKVLNLAKLSRIKLSDAEADSLSHEFDVILNYVGEVKSVATDSRQPTADNFPVRNIMRGDEVLYEPGVYTEKILAEAPAREANYLKVKKIL